MSRSGDPLDEPVSTGARRLALIHLDAAKGACKRLADDKDEEALHDFRVSLRRMRAVLRFYRPHLREAVPKKLVKKIRKTASLTGPGRDAEVQARWLGLREGRFAGRHRKGVRRLRFRIEAFRDESYARSVYRSRMDFRGWEPELRKGLSRTPRGRGKAEPSLARAAIGLAGTAAARLGRLLGSIRSARDVRGAHQARIAGKRLRYLVEPLRFRSPAWKRCGASLKKLQDILGELHDMHVLADEVARVAGEERGRGADRLPGLVRLAAHVRGRQDVLFCRLRKDWGAAARARFFGKIGAGC
ncbi:MAG: CHAD domain-containing protein [Elusimicrobiota bacterium]